MAFQDSSKKPWEEGCEDRKELLQKASPPGLLWNNRAEKWQRPAEEDPYKGAEKNNLQIASKSEIVDF